MLSCDYDTNLPDVSATGRPPTWKIVASLVVAAGLFALFVARAPLKEVLASAADVRIGAVLGAVALALLSYLFRALRWGLIVRPLGRAPAGALVGATAAGFAASTVLPARAGEVVRPLVLSARTHLPAAGTLASILAERLVDLATVVMLFVAGALFSPRLEPGAATVLRDGAFVAAGILLAGGLAVLLLLRFRSGALGWAARVGGHRFGAGFRSFVGHLLDGLDVIRRPRRLAVIGLWSLLVWLPVAAQIQVLAWGFRLALDPASAFVVIAVSVVGLAVPTPAGVGAFHAAVQFALSNLLGVALPTATAFALIHHAICFFPITLIGLAYLGAAGLTPGRAARLSPPHTSLAATDTEDS